MRYPSRYGQALTEYGVILGTVCVLAIPAVLLLGQNVQSGFLNMLGTGSEVPPSQGTPASEKAGSDLDARPETGNGLLITRTLALRDANPADRSPAPAISEQPVPPQVSGANGDVNQILENLNDLVALAQKLEQSNPTLSNMLYQLAQKGYSLASSMDNFYQTGGSIMNDEHGSLVDSNNNYSNFFLSSVRDSAEYLSLDRKDQKRIESLAMENSDLANKVVVKASKGNKGSGSSQVVNNSQQIETCADGQCGN